MSLCYDFSKWTMISLAGIAISLTVGLVSLAYGETTYLNKKVYDHCVNEELDDKESCKLIATFTNSTEKEDDDMITLNNSNIKVRQECVDIKEPSFNGDLEVSVWKHKQKFYGPNYLEVNIPCENWREVVQYYLNDGYMISFELDFVVDMVKRN
jgi:hypothetical protein